MQLHFDYYSKLSNYFEFDVEFHIYTVIGVFITLDLMFSGSRFIYFFRYLSL